MRCEISSLKKFTLLTLFILLGCNENTVSDVDDSDEQFVAELKPLPLPKPMPVIKPIPEPIPRPEIKPIPVPKPMPEVEPLQFYFSSDSVLQTKPVSREWYEGFDLDQVTFRLSPDHTYFEVINKTPRYIYKPKLFINSRIYQIDGELEPFEIMTVSLSDFTGKVEFIRFIDEQPMYKAKVTQYGGHEHHIVDDPEEEHAFQYEQELRGMKSFINDYEFTVRSVKYIDGWHAAQATSKNLKHQHDDGYVCPFETYYGEAEEVDTRAIPSMRVARANDKSTTNAKQLSLLAYQPQSKYVLLNNNSSNLGVATLGNGWLSVKPRFLYQTGQQLPTYVYFHEKMHNNGFNHSGGMTYGIPDDLFMPYIRQGNWFDNFYDSKANARATSPVATVFDVERISSDTVDIKIRFFADAEVTAKNTIDKFIIIPSDNLQIDSVKTVKAGIETEEVPLYTHGEGKILQFGEDLAINIRELNTQSKLSSREDVVIVRVSNFSDTAETIIFMGTDADNSKLQANVVIELDSDVGIETSSGLTLFTGKGKINDDGEMVVDFRGYTPEEAHSLCESKGLKLGPLPSTKREQIAFQHRYLPYRSQIGIDAVSGEAQAYMVPTGVQNNTHLVTPIDSGMLVVCH